MKSKIDTEKLRSDVINLRNKRNQSIDEACKQIGLSKPTISRIERGQTSLDALTLLLICKWLRKNPMNYLTHS